MLQRFEEGETERAELLHRLQARSADQLKTEPAPGKWSVLQILSHLTVVEGGSLSYLRKKSQAGVALRRTGWVARVRLRLLILGLRSPLKIKAPAGTSNLPETTDLATVRRRWVSIRTDWRAFLDGIDPELYDRAMFRHPFAGRFNLEQTVDFIGWLPEEVLRIWIHPKSNPPSGVPRAGGSAPLSPGRSRRGPSSPVYARVGAEPGTAGPSRTTKVGAHLRTLRRRSASALRFSSYARLG